MIKILLGLITVSVFSTAFADMSGDVDTLGNSEMRTTLTAEVSIPTATDTDVTTALAAKQARVKLAKEASEICKKAGANKFYLNDEQTFPSMYGVVVIANLSCQKTGPNNPGEMVVLPDSSLKK